MAHRPTDLFVRHSTIFAYGQTGSGKTHTILGPKDGVLVKPEEEGGIISRVVKDLFKEVEKSKSAAPAAALIETVELTVSFVEIYMEQIRDLLVAGSGGSSASAAAAAGGLKIRENAQKGIFIEDMTQVHTVTENATMELVKAGILNRAVSSTRMNKDSSRSHSILIITCTRKSLKNAVVKRSSMYIVDLAGSEFVNKTNAAGKVLQEAKAINKSLSALSNVIKALVEGKKHVPYRDSKLTRILQDSLGGSAKTCLILAASCSSYNMSETISTLRFGLRAKEIKNPVVQKQESAPGIGPGGIFKELYQQAMEELEEKNKKIDELQRLLSAVVQENQQLAASEQLRIQDEPSSDEQHDQSGGCDGAGGGGTLSCQDEAGRTISNEDTTDNAEHSSSEDEAEVEDVHELEAALREKEELAQKTVTLTEENKRLFHFLEALESQLDQVAVDFSSGKPILSLRAAASDARSALLSKQNPEATATAAAPTEHMLSLKIWLQSDKWQQSLELELIEATDEAKARAEPSPRPRTSATILPLAADDGAGEASHQQADAATPLTTITESVSSEQPTPPAMFLLPCANNTDKTPCVHRIDAEALSRQIVELKLQLHYVSENTKLALDGESYVIVLENAKLKTRIEELEFQVNLATVAGNQLEMKNRACETRLSNQETHIGCLQNSLQEYQGLFKQQIIMSQEKCRLLTDELEFYKKLAKCSQPLGSSGQHLSGGGGASPPKSSPSPRKHRVAAGSSSSVISTVPKVSAALFPEFNQESSPSPSSPTESESAGPNPFGLWRGFGSFYKSGAPTTSGGSVEIELAEKARASNSLPPAPSSILNVKMSRPIVKPIGAPPVVAAPPSTGATTTSGEKHRQHTARESGGSAPWIVKGFGVGSNDATAVGTATITSDARASLLPDATLDELAAPIEMH